MNGEQDRVRVLPHEQTTETDKRIRVKSGKSGGIPHNSRRSAKSGPEFRYTGNFIHLKLFRGHVAVIASLQLLGSIPCSSNVTRLRIVYEVSVIATRMRRTSGLRSIDPPFPSESKSTIHGVLIVTVQPYNKDEPESHLSAKLVNCEKTCSYTVG